MTIMIKLERAMNDLDLQIEILVNQSENKLYIDCSCFFTFDFILCAP